MSKVCLGKAWEVPSEELCYNSSEEQQVSLPGSQRTQSMTRVSGALLTSLQEKGAMYKDREIGQKDELHGKHGVGI